MNPRPAALDPALKKKGKGEEKEEGEDEEEEEEEERFLQGIVF